MIAVHAVVEARAVVCLRCGVRAWLMASRSVVKRLTVCVAFACWWGHLLTASGCHNDIVGDLNEQETREAAEKYLADHKVVQILEVGFNNVAIVAATAAFAPPHHRRCAVAHRTLCRI